MSRDIKAMVARLGGPVRVAELTGVHRRSIERYLSGEQKPPEVLWRFLERVEADRELTVTKGGVPIGSGLGDIGGKLQ